MSRQLVIPERFIEATRDSGYKSTARAICELVDNSLQAGASWVRIWFERVGNGAMPIEVSVLDDGRGMSEDELAMCLQFGGSSRFNDRSGFGRFGMGLPNASVSQARRVEVTSWRDGEPARQVHVDVDDIATGAAIGLAEAVSVDLPERWRGEAARHGTLVRWTRCDRLDRRKASTLSAQVRAVIARTYRHAIWAGKRIFVNGEEVIGEDPLFLDPRTERAGAKVYMEPLVYDLEYPDPATGFYHVGSVTVTFVELPVGNWAGLGVEEKRRLGISKGAGVSVVRGEREIDHGWFFLRGKRRENYDDWWRCEIRFPPTLDDAFGITHTKQQVRPREWLSEIIEDDMTQIARELGRRAREAHQASRSSPAAARGPECDVVAHKDQEDGARRRAQATAPTPGGTEIEQKGHEPREQAPRPVVISTSNGEPALPELLLHRVERAVKVACREWGLPSDTASGLTSRTLALLTKRQEHTYAVK